jgi:hypothetical protein
MRSQGAPNADHEIQYKLELVIGHSLSYCIGFISMVFQLAIKFEKAWNYGLIAVSTNGSAICSYALKPLTLGD